MFEQKDKENELSITLPQLEVLMESASKKGAQKVLLQMGIRNQEDMDSVREAADLGRTFKTMRKTALITATKIFTTALLGALFVGIALGFLKQGGP